MTSRCSPTWSSSFSSVSRTRSWRAFRPWGPAGQSAWGGCGVRELHDDAPRRRRDHSPLARGRPPGGHPAVRADRPAHVALVRHLASRPFFRPVQAQLPSQAPLLERVLWLAAHVDPEEGAWISLMVAGSAVAAAGDGIRPRCLPETAAPTASRGASCAGFRRARSRRSLRRPRRGSWVRATISIFPATMPPSWRSAAGTLEANPTNCRISGIRAFDPAVAARFSWELERAGTTWAFLAREELFVACAFGRARSSLQAAIGRGESVGVRNGAVHPRGPTDASRPHRPDFHRPPDPRVDRRIETGMVLGTEQIPVSTRPQPRRSGAVLFLGEFELETDAGQAFDMPAVFAETIRAWALSEIPDPFAPTAGGG